MTFVKHSHPTAANGAENSADPESRETGCSSAAGTAGWFRASRTARSANPTHIPPCSLWRESAAEEEKRSARKSTAEIGSNSAIPGYSPKPSRSRRGTAEWKRRSDATRGYPTKSAQGHKATSLSSLHTVVSREGETSMAYWRKEPGANMTRYSTI